jgi:hypothetical protein
MSYFVEFSATSVEPNALSVVPLSGAAPAAGGGSAPPPATVVLTGTLRLLRDTAVPASHSRATRTLFLPAVPLGFGAPELCAFFGPLRLALEHVRFLRSRAAGRYAVLLRFATQVAADRCVRSYSGRAFSSLVEPSALCRLMYVASVRLEWVGEGGAPELLAADALRLGGAAAPHPAAGGDALFASTTSGGGSCSGGGGSGDGGAGEGGRASGGRVVELPTCPVCLERLDSSASGLLTTLCQHSFHSGCISMWDGSDACPVCRYCMFTDEEALAGEEEAGGGGDGGEAGGAAATDGGGGGCGGGSNSANGPGAVEAGSGATASLLPDAASGPVRAAEDAAGARPPLPRAPASPPRRRGGARSAACEQCGLRGDLWMCLVCGSVGCGRYSKQHQLAHWLASGHAFAIELGSRRVWDYNTDR